MRKMLLFSLFALVIPLRAASPPIGAKVESWSIDAQNHTVTLHMLNTTGKDITFYNVSIKESYGANANEHQYSQEMLGIAEAINDPTYIHHDELRELFHGGNGTWQAGQLLDHVVVVQPGLTGFEAVIDVVTYADNTAEATNTDALNRMLAARKAAAQTLELANQAIVRALGNAADQAPHKTAAKEIEGLQKNWDAGGHRGNFHPGASGKVISDLDEAPAAAKYLGQTLPDYLNNLIARNQKKAALLSEHSAPKMVGGAK